MRPAIAAVMRKVHAGATLALGVLILSATLAAWTGAVSGLARGTHEALDWAAFLTGMALLAVLALVPLVVFVSPGTEKSNAAATRLALRTVPVLAAVVFLGRRRESAPLAAAAVSLALTAYAAWLLRTDA